MKVGWIVITKDGRMNTGTLEAESPEKVEQFMRNDPNVESVVALEEIESILVRS